MSNDGNATVNWEETCTLLRNELEQERVQHAGCLTAAEGWAGKAPPKKGDYGYSVAFEKTLELRQKYEATLLQVRAMEPVVGAARLMVKHQMDRHELGSCCNDVTPTNAYLLRRALEEWDRTETQKYEAAADYLLAEAKKIPLGESDPQRGFSSTYNALVFCEGILRKASETQ